MTNIRKVKIKGFTLAEVLITLGIIGVVAALTIPILINNANKAEYVTALKRSYAILSQINEMVGKDDGSLEDAVSNVTTSEGLANIFAQKMKFIKTVPLLQEKQVVLPRLSGC